MLNSTMAVAIEVHLHSCDGLMDLGTRQYLAPEMVIDDTHANSKADVYSFGVLMWEMYTRSYPYRHHKKSNVTKAIQVTHRLMRE